MKLKLATVLTLSGILVSLSAHADTIFDNSLHDESTRFNPGTLEVGDQVVLAGNARYLTNFSFEYWGTNTIADGNPLFSGNVEARVRFYKMDGFSFNGYTTPGTCLWSSDWFSVNPTPRSVLEYRPGLDFAAYSVYLPSSNLTWSVQFRGMGATDVVGVDFYSPAIVGADYPDYWQRDPDTDQWALMTNSIPTDFAATIEATLVPEPAVPFIAITRNGTDGTVWWPGWATNFMLEATSVLGGTWTPITTGITWTDNNFVKATSVSTGNEFFRLRKP